MSKDNPALKGLKYIVKISYFSLFNLSIDIFKLTSPSFSHGCQVIQTCLVVLHDVCIAKNIISLIMF